MTDKFTTGVQMIAAERQRQIEVEGFDAAHDNRYQRNELQAAAACYALFSSDVSGELKNVFTQLWPWPVKWFKPTNTIRDLTKAGALIAAALDREIRREQDEQSLDM